MSTKFFTNTNGNTLFEKFKELSHDMASFHYFQAVVGYFRSSGYFKLREELKNANKGEDVTKIQILIGINIDNIFRKHNKATLMFESAEEAKKIYTEDFINDVKDAKYSKSVEDGILQLSNDLASGRVEMRLHSSKNLHAKFYLCLPENHTPSNAGFVIMGSSNISDSGLGTHQAERYELNISTSEYDDVQFCKEQFAELWEQLTPIVLSDLPTQRTHLSSIQPTPYELYVKILIDTFGSQVEDDFTMDMPKGVRNLKYQKDAVSQGYQMLINHNGFFLADVVGLGKTIVATMIAKRFIEANGRHTRILVVHPPALHYNWKETFKLFGIEHKAHFINNGSLNKVVEGLDRYKEPSEYDLIIVDEAHGFRTGTANSYDELQRICKSKRTNPGLITGNKRIMLLSATPLNNRPEDLQNLILLFQDAARCTIEGVSNINNFFAPLTARYKRAMANRANNADTTEIDSIYLEIRERLLDKITVRRTRHNIWKDDNYRKDLESQHITFPTILPPTDYTYQMDTSLCELFYNTLNVLTDTPTAINVDGKGLYYARYRAIEYINEDEVPNNSAKQMALNLAGIYRVHMVKRLESSFYAFYRSLDTLLRITEDMIRMFEDGRVVIAPELKIKDFIKNASEGGEEFSEILDKFIEKAMSKGYTANEFVYAPQDFDKEYLKTLISDRDKLIDLKAKWEKTRQKGIDPKLDLFIEKMKGEFFNAKNNPTGKLVVFSESIDTVTYLTKAIKERLHRDDILCVSSNNRKTLEPVIRRCFDANINEEESSNEYNIIVTSDVLSEGINLHRSNVIVNYDTPWNATRLMQRIGRVNRIGSVAGKIYNYMFYPSHEGDRQIQLYRNALLKLQGFHSALGEDAQIFSKEEIVKEFQLFDPTVTDKIDKQLQLLQEVRALYQNNRELYKRIKSLPLKSRTARDSKFRIDSTNISTIVFVQSPLKTEYYTVENNNVTQIDFLDAVDIFKANISEPSVPMTPVEELHYKQVSLAIDKFESDFMAQTDTNSLTLSQKVDDKTTKTAQKFLRVFGDSVSQDDSVRNKCHELLVTVCDGRFKQLNTQLQKMGRRYKSDALMMRKAEYEIERIIDNMHKKYCSDNIQNNDIEYDAPNIVVSETFV